MQNLPTTLSLAFLLLLVATPVSQALPGDCVSASHYPEPGAGEFGSAASAYGYIFVMVPGSDSNGKMGTHYTAVDYQDIERCASGDTP